MLKLLRLATALALVFILTGCDVKWSYGRWGSGSLYGQVRIKPDGFPVADALLELDGPIRRRTTTSRNGTFSVGGLPDGYYRATLRALHGIYTSSVWVQGSEVFYWHVEPAGIDRELFYQLSGLKRYYIDNHGHLTWDYGELVRWEKGEIRVYLDAAGAPPGFYPTWPDQYFQAARQWESYLSGRINVRRVFHPADADIVVLWQPPGFLGDHAGIARHLAYYENGSLKKVQIEIDVRYGGHMGLWAHELAHAMGVEHVTDPFSVMYPRLQGSQRTTFSHAELKLVRLMYDIPSGQRLWGLAVMGFGEGDEIGYSDAAMEDFETGEAAAGSVQPLSVERPSGYRGHVMTESGTHTLLDEWDVQRLMDQTMR